MVNFCAAILILKMEEDMQHFGILCFIISRKVKNTTEMQKNICAVYGKGAVTDQTVKTALQSFLVLLTFWSNNSLLWEDV